MTWTSVRPDSPASESQPYLPLSAAVACSTTSDDTKSGYDFDGEEGEEEAALLLAVVGGAGFGPRLGMMGEGLVIPGITSGKVRALVFTRVRYELLSSRRSGLKYLIKLKKGFYSSISPKKISQMLL